MTKPIIFGEIKGIPEGYQFEDRRIMMKDSFHRNWAGGIDGTGKTGVAAIVLSGGYTDDEDLGDTIIYTGAGGNEGDSKKQIKDQDWNNRGNAGLLKSMDEGLPVRVIRGAKHKSPFSPKQGYKYAGLYSVIDAWDGIGKDGFKICRFKLEYTGGNPHRKTTEEIELDYSTKEKKRIESVVLRIVRDTKIAREVKQLYNYQCQICNETINTKVGRYAEGAHIKPLGKPHNGDDNTNNLICLCPNHHVMFDKGLFSISDEFNLLGDMAGKLILKEKHKLNLLNLAYHRLAHGYS